MMFFRQMYRPKKNLKIIFYQVYDDGMGAEQEGILIFRMLENGLTGSRAVGVCREKQGYCKR